MCFISCRYGDHEIIYKERALLNYIIYESKVASNKYVSLGVYPPLN